MGKTHLGGDWKLPLRKVRGLYRKAKQTRVTIRSEQEGAQKFDALYYRKICQLVSEIASYKKTTFKRVYSAAESRGCKRLSDYYRLLRSSEEERDYLRVNLTLKGTHFFRGEDWGSFAEECLSSFSGRDKVSVWCAGCSSGEEAYSTVMALLDYVPASSIDVLATDYNEELL